MVCLKCKIILVVAALASSLRVPTPSSCSRGVDRRVVFGGVVASSLAPLVSFAASERVVAGDGSFSFVAPEGFAAKPKPVQTHVAELLYKDENKREIGVIVDRVKLDSLTSFGTPDFVGEKVVASERLRDGVVTATFNSATQFSKNGETYYELNYENVSSRGDNRYVSRVCVKDGRLYILTLKSRIDDTAAVKILDAVADSFEVSGVSAAPVAQSKGNQSPLAKALTSS